MTLYYVDVQVPDGVELSKVPRRMESSLLSKVTNSRVP